MAYFVPGLKSVCDSKYAAELRETAKKIATRGHGILAADESTGTIGKRFDSIKLENTEENRRAYRELLFTTKGWGEYCSGVILYDETIRQSTKDGKPFVDIIKENDVVVGIKLDKGVVPILGTDGETATQGLDGLVGRCEEYYKLGARFAKWRAVLKIGTNEPSDVSLLENAHGLARYASICQATGLVPIIEPEVLMDGSHNIETTALATQRVWEVVIKTLHDHRIMFEGILLKPNMVLPGSEFGSKATPEEVAKFTVTTLQRTIPPAIPGIMFLSGGQSEEEATRNLNAINQYDGVKPWSLSFSYGRALQSTVIKTWAGKPENVEAAQAAFIRRARANSQAQWGKYTGDMEGTGEDSLYVKDYKY
eukprot:CAMPEP_0177646612 /NCGR_PEP_ID=MMETSP0447-20121125/9862_1 /TAXON_ID=0 /ORGANISM="Stygamoeba regulata, Strain BSH-02190019" /LENGTH=365 /DNA_ID=CAMNT_0019149147 /DNA_START=15 /DNA_END=1112 /DNA_ORIENTATION=+